MTENVDVDITDGTKLVGETGEVLTEQPVNLTHVISRYRLGRSDVAPEAGHASRAAARVVAA